MPELEEVLKKIDVLLINDAEARQLSGQYSIVKASKTILGMGPKFLIVKKENMAPCFFMVIKFSLLPLFHWKKYLTRQVPATHLQAGLLATWQKQKIYRSKT